MFQKTVGGMVEITGKALHSGRFVKVVIHPAHEDTGIIFKRVDSNLGVPLRAHAANITSTELSTTLGKGASLISTVEHLMAAFCLLGVDNAFVEIDGPELPILDGSAAPFIDKILRTGTVEQQSTRSVFRVIEPFEFVLGDRSIRIDPAKKFVSQCTIEFSRDVIGRQRASYSHEGNYKALTEARTFCHIDDINAMRRRGLALGGSLENAVVISDTGVVNEDGLRSENEFAEHKLLDLIGDLALLGKPILGKVSAFKPGHTLHANFMWELLSDMKKYLTVCQLGEPPVHPPLEKNLYAFG